MEAGASSSCWFDSLCPWLQKPNGYKGLLLNKTLKPYKDGILFIFSSAGYTCHSCMQTVPCFSTFVSIKIQ